MYSFLPSLLSCLSLHGLMASDLLLSLFASLGPDRLQSVLLGIVVLLAYRLEFTDTFPVHTQGFFCYDSAYAKPYPGPEAASRAPPALIYALVTAGPTFTVRWCGSPGGMPGSTDSPKAGRPGWGWGSAGLEGPEDPISVSSTDPAGGAGPRLLSCSALRQSCQWGEHHRVWGLLPLQPPTPEAGPFPG